MKLNLEVWGLKIEDWREFLSFCGSVLSCFEERALAFFRGRGWINFQYWSCRTSNALFETIVELKRNDWLFWLWQRNVERSKFLFRLEDFWFFDDLSFLKTKLNIEFEAIRQATDFCKDLVVTDGSGFLSSDSFWLSWLARSGWQAPTNFGSSSL